jgi:hypothetical protein
MLGGVLYEMLTAGRPPYHWLQSSLSLLSQRLTTTAAIRIPGTALSAPGLLGKNVLEAAALDGEAVPWCVQADATPRSSDRLATLKSILERCLAREPSLRWSLPDLLSALKELRDEELEEVEVPAPAASPVPRPPLLLAWVLPHGVRGHLVTVRLRLATRVQGPAVVSSSPHQPVAVLLDQDGVVTEVPLAPSSRTSPGALGPDHVDHDIPGLEPGREYRFRSALRSSGDGDERTSELSVATRVCVRNEIPAAPAVARDDGKVVVLRLHNPFHAALPPPDLVLVMHESASGVEEPGAGLHTEVVLDAGTGAHHEFTFAFPSLCARSDPWKFWVMYKFNLPQGAWHSASSPALVLPPRPCAPRLLRWDILDSDACTVGLALDNPWSAAVPCSTSVVLEVNGVSGPPIPVEPGQKLLHHSLPRATPGTVYLVRSRCRVEGQHALVLDWSDVGHVVVPPCPARPEVASVSPDSVGLEMHNPCFGLPGDTHGWQVTLQLQCCSADQRLEAAPIVRVPLGGVDDDSGALVPHLVSDLRGDCTQCFRSRVAVELPRGVGESVSEWSKAAKVPMVPRAPVMGGWSLDGGRGTATILVDNAWAPLDKWALWSVEVHVRSVQGEVMGPWVLTEAAPRLPVYVEGCVVGVPFQAWSRFRRQHWDDSSCLTSGVVHLVLPVVPGIPRPIVVKDSVFR